MSKTERRPRLTAARKLELYLATRAPDAPVGEILRQYGVHLDDLRSIDRIVESAALAGLRAQAQHGHRPTDLSPQRFQQLEHELSEKTHALAELSVQGLQRLAERATLMAATLTARRADPTARQFIKEDLIAHPLPNVCDYPNYSWAGPETARGRQPTPLD